MELGDPGFISMIGFGIVVIVGGLIMAAVSFLRLVYIYVCVCIIYNIFWFNCECNLQVHVCII